jgi:hypothetical protein
MDLARFSSILPPAARGVSRSHLRVYHSNESAAIPLRVGHDSAMMRLRFGYDSSSIGMMRRAFERLTKKLTCSLFHYAAHGSAVAESYVYELVAHV